MKILSIFKNEKKIKKTKNIYSHKTKERIIVIYYKCYKDEVRGGGGGDKNRIHT